MFQSDVTISLPHLATMATNKSNAKLLRPVAPPAIQQAIQIELDHYDPDALVDDSKLTLLQKKVRELLGKQTVKSLQIGKLKRLTPYDAQKFINYLGSRAWTIGRLVYTHPFPNQDDRAAFLVEGIHEFVSCIILTTFLD